ncbi:MAG: AAA family ATPase [Candidatus Fermentibacteraceae bacterium]
MSPGVYIAGSGKDAGKTTLCLGLSGVLNSMVPGGVSFFKPLGQKITVVDGESVGQDSWFISRALGLPGIQGESTPLLASRGAAERFVTTGEPRGIHNAVKRAFREHSRNSGLVLVEGTGHPGVGSVFDLGNARVASLLGIPVILVLDGGVGSTIDSFCLCRALFRTHGVPILGVVINRVKPDKYDSIASVLGLWFSGAGVPVFGVLPFVERIAMPSIASVTREIGALPLFTPEGPLSSNGSGFLTAFDSSDEVLSRIGREEGRALLVSRSRPEVLDAVIVSALSGGPRPSAVVVCGGEPDQRRQNACIASGIPLFHTAASLQGSADRLSGHVFKIEPDEGEKIASILEMVGRNVDSRRILEMLRGDGRSRERAPEKGVLGFLKRLFRRG